MNSKQIEAVLEVSRTLNFTKAADNLYITQPALTYSIKSFEEELGFKIFDRSQKGVGLTVAGNYFVKQLRNMENTYRTAVEQSLNLNAQFDDSLSICLPTRSSLYFLPEIISRFKEKYPKIQINIQYIYGNKRIDSLLNGSSDILFAIEDPNVKIPNTISQTIFESGIYLVCTKEDPLARNKEITTKDLDGYTLLVGGGSPYGLRKAQKQVLSRNKVNVLNSPDHETSLTLISLKEAINLIPGFLNDHNEEFAWIPFSTQERIPCQLVKRKDDSRPFVQDFIQMAKEIYSNHSNFKL
ncbi:MAG: LysR family transcriptional regulator [Firmicutes bacterium]|nr:LysR family transcriptional regulator [Bacillota bacterium]